MERVILGKHPDTGIVGMWVSRPGFNARTETNIDNYLIHPDTSLGRPYVSGTATVCYPTDLVLRFIWPTPSLYPGQYADLYWWTANITHNLGYVPVFQAVTGFVGFDQIYGDTQKVYARLNEQNYNDQHWIITANGRGLYGCRRYQSDNSIVPGSAYNGIYWYYDTGTNTMVWKGASTQRTRLVCFREGLST